MKGLVNERDLTNRGSNPFRSGAVSGYSLSTPTSENEKEFRGQSRRKHGLNLESLSSEKYPW